MDKEVVVRFALTPEQLSAQSATQTAAGGRPSPAAPTGPSTPISATPT